MLNSFTLKVLVPSYWTLWEFEVSSCWKVSSEMCLQQMSKKLRQLQPCTQVFLFHCKSFIMNYPRTSRIKIIQGLWTVTFFITFYSNFPYLLGKWCSFNGLHLWKFNRRVWLRIILFELANSQYKSSIQTITLTRVVVPTTQDAYCIKISKQSGKVTGRCEPRCN